MGKMGRPRKYSDEQIQEIITQFEDYITNTDIPIVAEFAIQIGTYKQQLYDYEEFSYLIKRAISKKEAALERQALNGEINTTMAIFSLKQLGWRDNKDTNVTGNIGITIIDDFGPGESKA